MSLVERIIWQGLQKPTAPALSLVARNRLVTYGDLNRGISNLSHRFRALGVVPGALYGLHIHDEFLHIAATFALDHLGAATVIVPTREHVEGWPIAGMFVEGGGDWPFAVEAIDPGWLEGDCDRPAEVSGSARPDDLCIVSWTSGSTGKPKGVPLTRRLAAMRAEQFEYRFGPEFTRSTRLFCSMGLTSGWTYPMLIYTLSRGGFFCLPDTSIEGSMRNLAVYKIQAMSVSPLYLAQIERVSRKEGNAFPSLKVLVTGGGMLPRPLAEKIRSTVCNRLISYYGSAECGGIAISPVELLDLERGDVGFVIPDVTVEIVDPESRTPLSGGRGSMRIRSERSVRGYFAARGEERTFDGDWVCSDDQATVSADGLLSVFGRNSNVVNLGGPKTTLEMIELQYAEAPGVAEVATLTTPDEMGIPRLVSVVVASDGWSEAGFWQHCQKKLAAEFWPKRVILVPSLPRVATGKIDRQKLPLLL